MAKPRATTIPAGAGVDGSGIVVAKGARVRRFHLGDRVYAYEFGNRHGGFYAEFAAARAEHVGRVPKGLDLRDAGAVATTGLTALQGIDARHEASVEQLRKFAPDGLDGVLALAGGHELERCLDFMRLKGRVVHPNGIEPVPMKRPTFRMRAFDAVANPREFDKLNRHLSNGRVRVPIAASYPLGKAAQAHRRLDREHALGRMVVRVRRHRH